MPRVGAHLVIVGSAQCPHPFIMPTAGGCRIARCDVAIVMEGNACGPADCYKRGESISAHLPRRSHRRAAVFRVVL